MLKTIGTRQEEDDSYNNIIILVVVLLLGVVLCSLLEIISYFLYNMKVGYTGCPKKTGEVALSLATVQNQILNKLLIHFDNL